MEIITTEELPVEASMAANNTCYIQCAVLNRRSNYGVCLFTVRAFKQGKLLDTSDCYSNIGRGLCPALKLQKQEQEAGRALFYKPRQIKLKVVDSEPSRQKITSPTDISNPSYMRGWNQVAGKSHGGVTRSAIAATKKPIAKKPTVKKPIAKKSAIFGTDKVDLSDAVSAAVKADKKSKPTVKPGMSILERARAMAGGL